MQPPRTNLNIENDTSLSGLLPRRRCGDSELTLPVLGLGCWAFGGGEYWGEYSQRDADAAVRCAVENGCNYFDTAEAYNGGGSESSLGKALKGITRDRVIIGTKVSPSNVSPATLVEHCEASLRRLQTDYIDLYMVHWPITAHSIQNFTTETMPVPSTIEAFKTLIQLQQAGKIRHIGVSNFSRSKLDEAMSTGAKIAVNQLPYSLLARSIEIDVMPYCLSKNIGVIGYMALWQGVLAGIYPTIDDIPVLMRRTRHFDSRRNSLIRHGLPGAEAETIAALSTIRAIAQANQLTMAELSLKWAIAGEGIACSIFSARSAKKLKENFDAVMIPLTPEIIDQLNLATQPLQDALGPSFDYWEHPDNDRTR